MRRLLGLVLIAVIAGALLWLWPRSPDRTLYRGGPILTLDPSNRVVQALAVEGERIAAVGSEAELASWVEGSTRIVDLAGRALIPGFIEAHGHFPGAGLTAVLLDLNSPPIGDVKAIGDLLARIEGRAAETRAQRWIVGLGYDDSLLAEARHPTRVDLDRVSPEHPVVIWHVSGHLAVGNSRALERWGIDASTPDPEGGRIRRDPASGEPDGVLEERAAEVFASASLEPSLLQSLRIVRKATARYLRAGVTTAQNGYAFREHVAGLALLSRLGLLPLRLVMWPSGEVADQMLAGDFEFESPDPDRLRMGAVKLVADGSIQGYTGYLSEPYHVPPGEDPTYRGYPVILRADLIERVARYHAAGLQIAVHGNGDASIDDILEAFEEAQKRHPRPDTRHVVVHAQMAREDQLERMARLGVIPSFFSLHTYYWGDRHRDIFMGPQRAARMSPARSALAHGLRFTIHADTPVVPMEPLRLVWAAVHRLSTSGASIGPGQRIRPTEALRAVTIDAAYQHFEEDSKGSLEVGKLADMVILSHSPLERAERIDRIRVLETIIGGRTAYLAENP